MKVTKEMKDGAHLVEFKVPYAGTFSVGHNCFKYSEPFAHYTEKEKKIHIKEHSEMEKYIVWHNGGGISHVNSVGEGLEVIEKYIKEWFKREIEGSIELLGGMMSTFRLTKDDKYWLNKFKKVSE